MTTWTRCPLDILFTSCWLFTMRRFTWPRNHLVPCVAELVGSCIPIHACRVFLIQNASLIHLVCRWASLATTSALSQSMMWFCSTAWSVMADLWVTLQSVSGGSGLCASCEGIHFFIILRPSFLPVSGRSTRFSPHLWPCPLDEPRYSVMYGGDG